MNPGTPRVRKLMALACAVGLLLGACAGGEVANPLRVDALYPASESENVWIRDPVWVRFSEPVDPASVTPTRVVVSSAEVASLAKDLSLSADGLTLSITLTEQPVLPATLTVALSREIATVDGRRLVPPSGGWWWKLPAWQVMGGPLNMDPARDGFVPSVAIGPSGPVVAWADHGGDVAQIRVKRWDGSDWVSLGGALNHSLANAADRPRVAIDPAGAPVVAWMEIHGEDANVYVKRWDGADWLPMGTVMDVDPTQYAETPDVVADADGVWLAWHEFDPDTSGMDVHVRRWDGAAWVAVGAAVDPHPAWNSGPPRMALGTDGLPVVTFTMVGPGDQYDAYVHRWTGTEWVILGGPIDDDPTRWVNIPRVAVDHDDAPIVAWEEFPWGGPATVQVKRWDGDAWVPMGGALNVTDSFDVHDPLVTVDPDGRPLVAWWETTGSHEISIFVRRWEGGVWVPLGDPASAAWSAIFDMAVGPDGEIVLAHWFGTSEGIIKVLVRRFNELP